MTRGSRWSWMLLAFVGVTALACGGGGSSSTANGRAKFELVCATCHGKDATGMEQLGKNLHGNAFIHSKTDDELVAFIKEGRPATHPDNTRGVDMPPKGGDPTMTDEDLRSIVAFLRTL